MRRRRLQLAAVVAVLGLLGIVTAAVAGGGGRDVREHLTGYAEVPAVSTLGSGEFRAEVRDLEISYKLSYRDLEGDVTQAHIHIGLPQNSGGVVLWLCDSTANPSPVATTPMCNVDNPSDLRSGRVSGTLTAADVQTVAANGIVGATATTPGEFEEVVALIRAGKTYANVHTTKFAPGEIRSQLDNRGNDHNGHGGDHNDR